MARKKKSLLTRAKSVLSMKGLERFVRSIAGQAAADAVRPQKASAPKYSAREYALLQQDRMRNGVTVPREREYSKLTQNLAKQLLSYGASVDPSFRAAALDAIQGGGAWKNERELQEFLRKGTDIRKSGAGAINRRFQQVRGFASSISRSANLFDAAKQGGFQGGMAQADLIQLLTDKAEDLTQNKFVQKITASVYKGMGWNPTTGLSRLRQIGRGLRLGGAVGAVMGQVMALASEHTDQQVRSSRAKLGSFSDSRSLGIDARVANRTRSGVLTNAGMTRIERVKSFFGFTGDLEEERRNRSLRVFKLISDSRQAAGQLGVDAAGVAARLADERGIPVENLNPQELNTVLQAQLLSASRAKVSKEAVQAELIRKGVIRNSPDAIDKFADQYAPMVSGKAGILMPGNVLPLFREGVKHAARFTDYLYSQNADGLEQASRDAEAELAGRIVANLIEEPEKRAAAARQARADVPPKTIQVRNADGSITIQDNPDYIQYRSDRHRTRQDVRKYDVERQSTLRRRQVVWGD